MEIKFTLRLTDDEKNQLKDILECSSDTELEKCLTDCAKASLEEYRGMFLGDKNFTRAIDIRAFRLYLLIKELYENEMPDESKVCRLFQTNPTESKSLIQTVMFKYQHKLKETINETLKKKLNDPNIGELNDEEFQIFIRNKHLITYLNELLSSFGGSLPKIVQKQGLVSTWKMKESSYKRLCTHFSITPLSPPVP